MLGHWADLAGRRAIPSIFGFPCVSFRILPESEPSRERVCIVAQTATLRELSQFPGAAPSQDDLVRVNRRHESFHHIDDMTAPSFFPKPFHTALPDITF